MTCSVILKLSYFFRINKSNLQYLRNRLVFQFNYLQLQKSLHSFKFGPICENKSKKKKWNRGRKESETNGSLEAKI